MKTIRRNEQIINKKETNEGLENIDTRVALVQALIPIGLQYVTELLQDEVEQLAGVRYSRQKGPARGNYRWGQQRAARYIWVSRKCRWRYRGSAISQQTRK